MSRRKMSSAMRSAKRARLIAKRGRRCHWCGRKTHESVKPPAIDALTLDHLVPLADGGGHSDKNLVIACYACNSTRGSKHGRPDDPGKPRAATTLAGYMRTFAP